MEVLRLDEDGYLAVFRECEISDGYGERGEHLGRHEKQPEDRRVPVRFKGHHPVGGGKCNREHEGHRRACRKGGALAFPLGLTRLVLSLRPTAEQEGDPYPDRKVDHGADSKPHRVKESHA